MSPERERLAIWCERAAIVGILAMWLWVLDLSLMMAVLAYCFWRSPKWWGGAVLASLALYLVAVSSTLGASHWAIIVLGYATASIALCAMWLRRPPGLSLERVFPVTAALLALHFLASAAAIAVFGTSPRAVIAALILIAGLGGWFSWRVWHGRALEGAAVYAGIILLLYGVLGLVAPLIDPRTLWLVPIGALNLAAAIAIFRAYSLGSSRKAAVS